MSTDSIEKVLDLEGLLCPIPVVKISNAIKEVEVGDVIEATATDPGVMMDIAIFHITISGLTGKYGLLSMINPVCRLKYQRKKEDVSA